MVVIHSDSFVLGKNGHLSSGLGGSVLTLHKLDGTACRYALEQLTYLKRLSRTDHKTTTPSLTAAAQSAGTIAVSAGFLMGGSLAGGIISALAGHRLVQNTQRAHHQKIAKTTYQLQVGFDDNTTAILEVDQKEYNAFAQYFDRFALI